LTCKKLSVKDLCMLRRVCKRFYSIVRNNKAIFRRILYQKFIWSITKRVKIGPDHYCPNLYPILEAIEVRCDREVNAELILCVGGARVFSRHMFLGRGRTLRTNLGGLWPICCNYYHDVHVYLRNVSDGIYVPDAEITCVMLDFGMKQCFLTHNRSGNGFLNQRPVVYLFQLSHFGIRQGFGIIGPCTHFKAHKCEYRDYLNRIRSPLLQI